MAASEDLPVWLDRLITACCGCVWGRQSDLAYRVAPMANDHWHVRLAPVPLLAKKSKNNRTHHEGLNVNLPVLSGCFDTVKSLHYVTGCKEHEERSLRLVGDVEQHHVTLRLLFVPFEDEEPVIVDSYTAYDQCPYLDLL